jgi:S-DNA-T family DNA segregation ATPase FtsK/SpoIIIE
MTSPSHDTLNFQADRIERVLASHRVPVRVHGGNVSPRWIRFLLTPALGARMATVRNLSEELAMALGAEDVRVGREGESIAIEVPRADAEPVHLTRLLRTFSSVPPLTACLGITEEGRPLMLRLPSPDVAHVLVAGATGSGKTELMRSLVVSLALLNRQSRLQIALIDPKSRGFLPLAGLPHVIGELASDPTSAMRLLDRLVAEMERRDRENVCSPRIVIVVDELLDLLATGGPAVETALTRLAQRGREAGLHLIAGAQKPSSAALGSMLKANFPVRLVGRVGSADDARVAAGQSGTGAEKLLGRGDFVLVASGTTVRFQAAWIPAAEWPEILSDVVG